MTQWVRHSTYTTVSPALYPGGNDGISRTPNVNNQNITHVLCKTHGQKATTVEPVDVLFNVLQYRKRRRFVATSRWSSIPVPPTAASLSSPVPWDAMQGQDKRKKKRKENWKEGLGREHKGRIGIVEKYEDEWLQEFMGRETKSYLHCHAWPIGKATHIESKCGKPTNGNANASETWYSYGNQ